MLKAVVLGGWACAVVLAAQFGTNAFLEKQANAAAHPASAKLETRKTAEISIPKIKNGAVKGYVIVRLNYVVDPSASKVPPDIFLNDELFRYIYQDDSIDFEHLEKYDLRKLYTALIANVNARVSAKAVNDIAVQEFAFVPTAEAAKKP